jgi:histidyl-tRNA synthetase
MSTLSNQPYKGTRDFYPEDMRFRRWMFDKLRDTVGRFGFQEYDGPMLEPFELYAAKTGEEIVNQQLYWLVDRGKRKLAVRPEMTPTLARMASAKIHELPRPLRWFSIPNLWRYERPQRGRLREHWQLNVDILGGDSHLADAEILVVALDILKSFGGEKFGVIKVNHRKLIDSFFKEGLGLDAKSSLAVIKAIDARPKMGEEAYAKALSELGVSVQNQTKLESFFKASLKEMAKLAPGQGCEELTTLLTQMQAEGRSGQVVFDPTIMRGLDYYTGTVFEMFDQSPENNRAMFGGGRYENLVGMFGKEQLPGVGFGMGDVTLELFLRTHGLVPPLDSGIDVFVSLHSEEQLGVSQKIAQMLRDGGLSVISPLSIGGFGAQLKLAVKHGAKFAVLLGDEELKSQKVVLKNLIQQTQEIVSISDLPKILQKNKP